MLPLSSLLSSSLLLAFQPVPFGFSQEDFGLKPFSFWENPKDLAERQKEDDEEDDKNEEDEESHKDEHKAGDHSCKELISSYFKGFK